MYIDSLIKTCSMGHRCTAEALWQHTLCSTNRYTKYNFQTHNLNLMRKYKIELKWAILFAGMMLAWMLLERLAGLHDEHIAKHAAYTNLVAIPSVALYAFALLDKRKNYYNGTMTYLQGFVAGLIITAIVTVLSPLTQYITSTLITPEYFQNVIAYAVQAGKMTQADAESYFNLQNYIVQGLVGAPVMGILTAAIVAFFTRSKAPNHTSGAVSAPVV